MRSLSVLLLFLLMSTGLLAAEDKVVISDAGVEITYEEMKAALTMIPRAMRSLAADDVGQRFELINNMVQIRKLAAKAEDLTPEVPRYWQLQFEILALKRNFIFELEQADVELPDPIPLAEEYYETQKDKYALEPETRSSSHILFASPPGLPREELRDKAQSILGELRAGANFEDYVEKYSQDPGSKRRSGSLDKWITLGDRLITPPYSGALFEIEQIGEYSEVTDSEFGVHIIRLDGIREAGYRSFEEVKEDIFRDILVEFQSLIAKQVNARYTITEDAFIDGRAMEELFAPYKKASTP